MKVLAFIAQGVDIEHQTKIHLARTAKETWETLREYHNQQNLLNRVAVTRRLHDFKMESGVTMTAHIDKLDELVVALELVGEPMDEARQLVKLLGSLPIEYKMIVAIVENMREVALIDVKEKLLKAYDKIHDKEKVEAAFKAQFASKKKQGHAKYGGKDKKRVFKGRCFKCNKKGHMEKDCRSEQAATREEVLFMATDDHAIG
jgi:hypothetical protein